MTPGNGGAPDGPDVICIGLPKAGTQWLYDQMNGHPDFWMPPLKELRFFERNFPTRDMVHSVVLKRAKIRRARERGESPPERRTAEDRDLAFVEIVKSMTSKDGKDLDTYARLFSPKSGLLTGDISPIYAALDEAAIDPIAERFQRTKIVMLLRDPVERAWSHWRMRVDKRLGKKLELQDVSALRAFLEHEQMAMRSSPTEVVKRWSERFDGRFRTYFLDDIAKKPQETRAEILSFVGADPSKESRLPPDHNRKASPRVKRSRDVQDFMRETFADERRRCAEVFGGPALAWIDAPF